MGHSVDDVLNVPFSARAFAGCMNIVEEDKPRPPLPNLLCKHKDAKTEYTRHFSVSQHDAVDWLTGCEVRSRHFVGLVYYSPKRKVFGISTRIPILII
jgi:hypothetical protein